MAGDNSDSRAVEGRKRVAGSPAAPWARRLVCGPVERRKEKKRDSRRGSGTRRELGHWVAT